ncbi:MAG: glycosyltransferase [Phycisphaerae bacterium]|nr:glycosyltransferase [Phycisphaerae bacterium]
MRVWMVLPAYNEADNLPPVFDGCRHLMAETYNLDLKLIVVDDGSTDETVEVTRTHGDGLSVEILENGTNRGLAATFMRGMVAAARQAGPHDVIMCMDADNSHLPGQLQRMIRNIQEGRDVVIASRYQPGATIRGVPLSRRVLSRGMSLLFRAVYPIAGVRDYSCGFRAYRAAFLQEALASQGNRVFATEGFACMVGILLRLAKQGAVFGEVPIILRYDQKVGETKMKVGSTIARTLLVLLRERLDWADRKPRRWATALSRAFAALRSRSVRPAS